MNLCLNSHGIVQYLSRSEKCSVHTVVNEMGSGGVIVNLGSLENGEHHFEFSPDPDALELDDRFSNIQVSVRVFLTGTDVIATIDSQATVRLVCDRSLKEFDSTLRGDSTVMGASVVTETTDRYDDVVEISAADQSMDVSSVVRDTLLLAIPSRAVAPGEEDSPITTVFTDDDADDRIDPRWEGLKKIKEQGMKDRETDRPY
ncbi:MAG: DUF177 domain-containing protein [Rhodothermales bacterium]|nr:DUF177 domain-containing protein [Rhodothermales bacterium]